MANRVDVSDKKEYQREALVLTALVWNVGP